jgi:hypothetical protein
MHNWFLTHSNTWRSPTSWKLVDAVSGTEYVPTYEDKDGDWMLAGDVPCR